MRLVKNRARCVHKVQTCCVTIQTKSAKQTVWHHASNPSAPSVVCPSPSTKTPGSSYLVLCCQTLLQVPCGVARTNVSRSNSPNSQQHAAVLATPVLGKVEEAGRKLELKALKAPGMLSVGTRGFVQISNESTVLWDICALWRLMLVSD